ncbi:MAG: YceD family protein [Anaerolineae bacterium]
MIRLNLSTLAHARVGKQESIDLDIDRVTVGELELSDLQGNLRFTRVAEGILVQGELEADVKTECTRCLTPFKEPITQELEDTIGLPGAELTPERPVRVDEDGWANLVPLIREYAWLGLPVSPVCSPGCKGICPECGGNRNLGECVCEDVEHIDPRWDALRALVDDGEGS